MARKKRRPPVVLILFILVLCVPLIIAGAVLYSTLEDSSQPVVANRFNNELNPAITETQLETVKTSLKEDRIEKIEISCISATVRILIDTYDEINQLEVDEIISSSLTTINEYLPIDTYFTNTETTKMYDLEIHVYNVVKGENKIYTICTKTAASESYVIDNVAIAKNQEIADSILNPAGENTEGSGETE